MGYASELDQQLEVSLSIAETEERQRAEEIGDPDVFVTDKGDLAKPSTAQADTPRIVEERNLRTWD